VIDIRQGVFGSDVFGHCFAIRWTVFVEEQNVPPGEERDRFDETALHFLALVDDEPAATARAAHKSPRLIKIGRVAVLKPFRGAGLGARLMQAVHIGYPDSDFTLDAQLQALPFYERQGYQAEGSIFDDAGIPHRRMVRLSPSHR
jgi:predicted GNAT family N-acyltransferase